MDEQRQKSIQKKAEAIFKTRIIIEFLMKRLKTYMKLSRGRGCPESVRVMWACWTKVAAPDALSFISIEELKKEIESW
jgi:hypothetical protein